ncbi:MAG TPA: hypothetical protein VGR08_07430 [Thermomicrobiales bacterium]|nr:hypothetical protein [Thermomicrobiales bacterium]
MNGRADESAADHDDPSRAQCAFTEEHAAGYALGALDRFDRGLVDQHLRWCERCRELVDAAESVTARLAFLSPPVAPLSANVRSALMERIAADATGPIVAVPPVSSRPAIVSAPAETGQTPRATTRRWSRVLPAALIAPLAIALIGVLAWANSLQNTIDEHESELATLQQANARGNSAGEFRLFSMDAEPSCSDCNGSSRLGVDMDESIGVVVAWNLDPRKEHSLWCVDREGEEKWLSILKVDQDGGAMQTFAFPGNASAYAEVYIATDDDSKAYMTSIATPGVPLAD